MTPRRRRTLIALGAVATGIAAYFAPPPAGKPIEVVMPVVPAAARPAALGTQLPVREPMGRGRGDLFATRSWAPPPPKLQAEPAALPAPPAPPPNPYRFAGTLLQGGKRSVFLLLGDRLVEAKEGEMLEQNFRVQSVTADAVTLVYVPLEAPVTMTLVFPETPAAASAPPPSRRH